MLQIKFKPEIHFFPDYRAFLLEFPFEESDLLLTNRYIFEPFFGKDQFPGHCVWQEDFGSGEPTDVMVDAILDSLRQVPFRRIVAIGGGTVIDIAKILAVAEKRDDVDSLYDRMSSLSREHELMVIPTTCGTGSEVTSISILNRTRLGTKLGLVSDAMYPTHAVLIPELLRSLPSGIFATSSIDALVHAVESALSGKATPYTRMFSFKAMEMIVRGYQRIRDEGPAVRAELMGDFLLASNFAGLAFGTAGCAAVHALSYPLSGTFHVPHGEANYAVFTGVMKEYRAAGEHMAFAELTAFLASLLDCPEKDVFEALDELLATILPLKPLRDYGMTERLAEEFARTVLASQQRLLVNSPVELSETQISGIYIRCL